MLNFFPSLFLLLLPCMGAWGHFRRLSVKTMDYEEKMPPTPLKAGGISAFFGDIVPRKLPHRPCSRLNRWFFGVKNARFFRGLFVPKSGCIKAIVFNFSVFRQFVAGALS